VKINSDFKDLLQSLNAAGVRYLIVEGYAVMAYTEPRYTKDLDVWIESTDANAEALFRALASFGAPTKDVSPKDFTEPNVSFQIGVAPVRIDIMTSVPGLDFSDSWKQRLVMDFGGEPVPVICRSDVIRAKREAGRLSDKKDIERDSHARRHHEHPGRKWGEDGLAPNDCTMSLERR
jgi:hypothetical protein